MFTICQDLQHWMTIKFDTIGGYILYNLRCFCISVSWMSLQDVFQRIEVECMQSPSCRQRQVEETMKDGLACCWLFWRRLCILCHTSFPCRLAALFIILLLSWMYFLDTEVMFNNATVQLLAIQVGRIGSAADAEDVTRTWCKAVDRWGWSGCLQRCLFCSCSCFQGNINRYILMTEKWKLFCFFVECWQVAGDWFLTPWINITYSYLQVGEEYWSFPAAATTTVGTEIWIWESKGPDWTRRWIWNESLQESHSNFLSFGCFERWVSFSILVGLHNWGFDSWYYVPKIL